MTLCEPTISVTVDPTNPGQFFACCGLLELADRLWDGAEGWFNSSAMEFCIAAVGSPRVAGEDHFLGELTACRLSNTMSEEQVQRFGELKGKRERDLSPGEKSEKKHLSKLWREEPLFFHVPFNLRVDWFIDRHAGGNRFKTWAGQQSVIDIAQTMKQPLEAGEFANLPASDWLRYSAGDGVSFNFDSDLGSQSSPLDVGFSLDPLEMLCRTRPLLELAALVGLQRFRPAADSTPNRYLYTTWTTPLLPAAAVAAASGYISEPESLSFEFRLLYRTKYLKSFLPAQPVRGRI